MLFVQPGFHRRLAFRVLFPIVCFVAVFSAVSFAVVDVGARGLVNSEAATSLHLRAETIRVVVEAKLHELQRSGRAADAPSVAAQKADALMAVDQLAQNGLLRIAVFDHAEQRVRGFGNLDAVPPEAAILNDDEVHTFQVEGQTFYAYSFPITPWQWQVTIVKEGGEYDAIRQRLRRAAWLAAAALIVAISLFLVYVTAITQRPVQAIIRDLVAGRAPQYAGIDEFAYLSRSIAGMMSSLQEKNLALENYNSNLERVVGERTKALEQAVEELRLANAEIRNAQQQMLQSEKLASIGQLAAGVAHEINNPIGFVKSNLAALETYFYALVGLVDAYARHAGGFPAGGDAAAEIAAARAAADLDYMKEDLPALLAESKQGVARVKKIVEDLRDFARIDDNAWVRFDIRRCLDTTLGVVGGELGDKIDIVRDYAAIPEIECLPSEINQVLMNLLVNAGQAMAGKGTITLRTRAVDDKVIVEVVDDGCGIAPDALPKIFDPFFTTKPVGTGTGLGLSLCYSIVRKHHGRIDVRSTPGEGATFMLELPVCQPAGEAVPASRTESPSA